jgi:hypothetical protein
MQTTIQTARERRAQVRRVFQIPARESSGYPSRRKQDGGRPCESNATRSGLSRAAGGAIPVLLGDTGAWLTVINLSPPTRMELWVEQAKARAEGR